MFRVAIVKILKYSTYVINRFPEMLETPYPYLDLA